MNDCLYSVLENHLKKKSGFAVYFAGAGDTVASLPVELTDR